MMSRILVRLGAAVVVLMLLLVGTGLALGKSRPETGDQGPAAEQMTARMEASVNLEAWARTGAVAWSYAGRNEHLWDRERGLSRVRWGNVEVLQRTDQRVGRVFRGGREIHGEARERLVEKAWSFFINDSFWLNPVATLRNRDVVRSVVDWKGEPALLVEYGTGGVTPGDAYLWLVDDRGRPTRWHMWVQILPIGGIGASWDDWTELPTGAMVSTKHALGPVSVRVEDLRAAATLSELEPGTDPFDQLVNW